MSKRIFGKRKTENIQLVVISENEEKQKVTNRKKVKRVKVKNRQPLIELEE